MEIWDAYDRSFNRIKNQTLIRGEPIPDNVYHLVCEIIVKHIDGSYLIMQRDFRKPFGGKWELTAGGSALQGEDAFQGALRELKEETGLIASSLKEIRRVINDQNHTLYVIYFYAADCPKDSVLLQEGETVAYQWVDRKTLLEMSGRELISYREMACIKELDL